MSCSTSSKHDGRSWTMILVLGIFTALKKGVILCLLLLPLAVLAQESAKIELGSEDDSSAKLPTAEDIFDRYAQSLGGKDKLMAIQSRVVSGSVEITDFGIKANAIIEEKAPYFRKFSFLAPGLGESVEIYTENQGWIKSPNLGVVQKSTEELRLNKRINGFYRDVSFQKIYQSFSVTELTQAQNEDVYVVECISGNGEVDRLYFSVNSGLLIKEEPYSVAQGGNSNFAIYYEEYDILNGISYPSKIRVQPPFGGVIRFEVEQINFDKPIQDSYFSKPEEKK